MNYMNELLEGKVTPEELQTEYCNYIIKLLKKHYEDYCKDPQTFIDTFGAFEHLGKKDRENLMILIEKVMPENLKGQKSRFSDEIYTAKESDFVPKIKEYTDKMLLRLVANETCQPDLKTNSVENTHMYHILKRLGLNEIKRDPYIPEIISGNYRLLRQRIGLENKIQKLLEVEERMMFFIDYLEKNPNEAAKITSKNMNDIMRDGDLNQIIKLRYGHMKTMESIVDENFDKGEILFEKYRGIRVEGNKFDNGTHGGNMLSKIVSRKGKNAEVVDVYTYEELDKMGYASSFQNGLPILKSGYKYYEQLTALNLLEKDIYSRIEKNSKELTQYSKVINYYRNNAKKDCNAKDEFINYCMLYYDRKKSKQKAKEPGLIDTMIKAGKKTWEMSQFIADGMIDVENWLITRASNVKGKFDEKLGKMRDEVKLKPYQVRDHDEPLVFVERLSKKQIDAINEAKKRRAYEKKMRKEQRRK